MVSQIFGLIYKIFHGLLIHIYLCIISISLSIGFMFVFLHSFYMWFHFRCDSFMVYNIYWIKECDIYRCVNLNRREATSFLVCVDSLMKHDFIIESFQNLMRCLTQRNLFISIRNFPLKSLNLSIFDQTNSLLSWTIIEWIWT